jgi:DNA-binding NarL/FixJ family response regulator
LPKTLKRILVVEDYRPYRSLVASLLSENFEANVYEAEDGLEAVVQAQRVKPDVVLIDIGLPKLNGLEVARQIRKLVTNSKILFLSAVRDQEIAEEALRIGASGYVLKSDAGRELVEAVKAVLQGKQFVSCALMQHIDDIKETHASDYSSSRRHEVQFYSDDALILESVTRFIWTSLKTGNAGIVFATKPHRDGLLRQLRAQGVDADAAIQRGTYISLDAAEVLSAFMIDDWPDAIRFTEVFGDLIPSALKAAAAVGPRVAIFGEAVALLWAEGKSDAAIRLEQLANELVKAYPVDILCAYPSSLHIQEDESAFDAISAEHSAVWSP